MDTPATPPSATPPTPPPLRPLGRTFVLTVLAPFVPLVICLLTALAEGRNSKDSVVPMLFLFGSLPIMLGCSIASAIQLGSRKGAGLGILVFIGTQILYLSAAFAGCVASLSHMDFK